MDDIVQRLRWWAAKKKPPHGMDTLPHDCAAGAAEIERLRALVSSSEAERYRVCGKLNLENHQMRTELDARVGDLVMPQDVINLVIAAREAFDTGTLPDEESRALDKALEAFSSRIPYENQLDDGDHEDLP